MKIAFISSEVYPFAKTGGLADVSYALPKALAKAGHEVIVFMPAYNAVDKINYNLNLLKPDLKVQLGHDNKWSAVYESSHIPEFKTYFIDNRAYFNRDGIYGDNNYAYEDNDERFAFLAKAVLISIKEMGNKPAIIHCNDWHTGLVPVYLKTKFKSDNFYRDIKTVFTIHNAGYQGHFFKSSIINEEFGINSSNDMLKLIHKEGINYLKGGILFSDILTTVSEKYAEEIQTEEFGYDLAYVFRNTKNRLFGISNAIDHETWNPAKDVYLPANFSANDLSGKKKCKLELLEKTGLPADTDIPVAGTISRLTYQKGMDVLADTLELLLQDEKFRFIIIGAGDKDISNKFDHLKKMFPDQVGIYWGYSEEMEHLTEAGLDIFIMPSRYEPCGLNQMYSLVYGTVPVVRSTGGLDDVIDEWDDNKKTGNGFKFKNLAIEELYTIMRKVLKKYCNTEDWEILQRNSMKFSYSWGDAVKKYEKVYQCALSK